MSKKRTDRLIGLAVDIRDDLEHICERADGVYDIRETLHSIDSALAAIAENRCLTPIYHDPTPGDYGTDQCPRTSSAGADVPQEATIPPAPDARTVDPGTREGEAAKPPQNAACEWPTEPGLYWVRGVDAGEPVGGVAILDDEPPRRVLAFVRDHSICEDEADDRLDEAVPLTAVPTELIDRLLSADEVPVWADVVEDIARWLDDHEGGAR